MFTLISEETFARLLSLCGGKKLTFLLMLYERMVPELEKFCLAENRDFGVFQTARESFWKSLLGLKPSIAWERLREEILSQTPDSEHFGSLLASLALNAALVGADAAGFKNDGQDQHIVEAIGYARDSLDAIIRSEAPLDLASKRPRLHELTRRERIAEEDDVLLLSTLTDPPWPEDIVSTIRYRSKTQLSLLAVQSYQ